MDDMDKNMNGVDNKKERGTLEGKCCLVLVRKQKVSPSFSRIVFRKKCS